MLPDTPNVGDVPLPASNTLESQIPKKKPSRTRKTSKHLHNVQSKTASKISVNYAPYPHQKEFARMFEQGKRVVLFLGGIRSGKTTAGAYESLKQIYKYHRLPNLGWIVSPTYPMSLVTERAFEEAAGDLIIKKYRGERAYLLFPHARSNTPFRVEVKSADSPDRLRGAGLGFIWADEAAMFTEDTWKILLGRVLDTQGIIFLTTTPRGKNWLYSRVYEESLHNVQYGVVKAKSEDNQSLKPEDVAALRLQYSQAFADQELNAEFVAFEGLVYRGFDFRRHVVPPFTQLPEDSELLGGIDMGYADPFVHLWVVRTKDRFYVVDEYYEKFRTMETHSQAIKTARWDKQVIRRWADPSGAQESADLLRYGIGSNPARNDLKAGIDTVERLFEQNKLFITSNCLNVLKELAEYHYVNKDGKNSGEEPIDYANHTMDALRYVLFSEVEYSQAHPYITVGDDGVLQVHEGTQNPFSNRLDDWIKTPDIAQPYVDDGGY